MTMNTTTSNVIPGPWGGFVHRKPKRRMTRAERQAFDAFENWLSGTLAFLSRTGREFRLEAKTTALGKDGEENTVDLQDFLAQAKSDISLGLTVARARKVDLAASRPPLPEVWPENFNVEFARNLAAAFEAA